MLTRKYQLGWLLCLALGCGPNAKNSLPVTPPPATKPFPTPDIVYRPSFTINGKVSSAGTVFFVQAPSGQLLALTAAHLLEHKEWQQLQSISLVTITGDPVAPLAKKPDYLGKAFDELPPISSAFAQVPNTSQDFVFWKVEKNDQLHVLELADHEPLVNEWVWVVGRENGMPAAQFYRAVVQRVYNGTFFFKQHDKFNPIGFSGGPVLTAECKVIGTMLMGNPADDMRAGATVGNIRKRLEGY